MVFSLTKSHENKSGRAQLILQVCVETTRQETGRFSAVPRVIGKLCGQLHRQLCRLDCCAISTQLCIGATCQIFFEQCSKSFTIRRDRSSSQSTFERLIFRQQVMMAELMKLQKIAMPSWHGRLTLAYLLFLFAGGTGGRTALTVAPCLLRSPSYFGIDQDSTLNSSSFVIFTSLLVILFCDRQCVPHRLH